MHALLIALWLGLFLGLVWGVQKPWAVGVGILPALIWVQVLIWSSHIRFHGERTRPKKRQPQNRQRALSKASQAVTGDKPLLSAGRFSRFRSQLMKTQQKGLLTGQQPQTRRFRFSSFSPLPKQPDPPTQIQSVPPKPALSRPVPVKPAPTNSAPTNPAIAKPVPKTLEEKPSQDRTYKPSSVPKILENKASKALADQPSVSESPPKQLTRVPKTPVRQNTSQPSLKNMPPELSKTRRQLASQGTIDESQNMLGIFDDLRIPPKKKTSLLISAQKQVNPQHQKSTPPKNKLSKIAPKVSSQPNRNTANQPKTQPLNLATVACANGEWEKARLQINSHISQSQSPQPQALKLQTMLNLHDANPENASQYLAQWLKLQPNLELADLQDLWNCLPDNASTDLTQLTQKQTLQTLIQQAQISKNYQTLQDCYPLLSSLLEKLGEQQELIQCLRQQLQLHEQLGDIPKQLELIDQLGRHYYNMKQTNEAQACYKAGLKLKEQLSNSAS